MMTLMIADENEKLLLKDILGNEIFRQKDSLGENIT